MVRHTDVEAHTSSSEERGGEGGGRNADDVCITFDCFDRMMVMERHAIHIGRVHWFLLA